MGVEVAILASVLGSVIGGIQQSKEAERQARLTQEQATSRARIEAREAIGVEKRQKLAFLKSGVALAGSPLATLAETRRRGLENVGAITQTGAAQAKSLRSSGKQALISGFTSAATTAAGGFSPGGGFSGGS